MSKFPLLRLLILLFLALTISNGESTSLHPIPGINVEPQPAEGTAPLEVNFSGVVYGEMCPCAISYTVFFGDGSSHSGSFSADEIAAGENTFSVGHTYECPGLYRLKATVGNCCDSGEMKYKYISVEKPQVTLVPLYLSYRGSPAAVKIATLSDFVSKSISQSTINWGDGTPIETFVWEIGSGYFATPPHLYTSDGTFVVSVKNEYVGERCSFNHISVVEVHAGKPLASRASTWGSIKSLFGGQ